MANIKQVIVMRTDLNMRKGKMISQGAHAAMLFMAERIKKILLDSRKEYPVAPLLANVFDQAQEDWLFTNFKKITVRADSEAHLLEIFETAKAAGLEAHLVTDSGLTEFNGVATNTCIAIGPDFDEKINPITGNLQLL